METVSETWQLWSQMPLWGAVLRIGLILLFALVLVAMSGAIARRVDRRVQGQLEGGPTAALKRRRTLMATVRFTINAIVIGTVALLILRELGIDLAPLLAGAGVAGIVIGLGTQSLMRDILGGVTLLLEDHYAVGDFVSTAGVTGTVERITLRMTQLRDIHGALHVVPNGHGGTVTNLTKGWSMAVLDVSVAYKEDVARVSDVLADIGRELEHDPDWGPKLVEPLIVLGVQVLNESSVDIRVTAKLPPEDRFDFLRFLRGRIKTRFDTEGIEIPFPHRTVYVGSGAAGVLRASIESDESDES
jgi:small-conductance mechanosensitive channel